MGRQDRNLTTTWDDRGNVREPPDAASRTLIVYGPTTSSRVGLPMIGSWIIGRSPDVDLTIEDTSVSRRHARIECSLAGLKLVDLGSHNGTRVNGVRIETNRELALHRGDVVEIGSTTIIVSLSVQGSHIRRCLDGAELRARIGEHIERARREAYVFAVLLIVADDAPQLAQTEELRVEVSAHDDLGLDGGALVIVAQLDEEDAEAHAERLLKAARAAGSTRARVGIAEGPRDGADADTLLAAAREGARTADSTRVGAAREAYATRTLGDVSVLIADPAMERAYSLLERLARGAMPVLIRGETGTGKELAARAVHAYSARATSAFVAVNCAALADSLIEAELFGYEKGAFTGATTTRKGLFESAHGGTLFLDEIGELSQAAQAKLLRVLETGILRRVGGTEDISVDVRLVTATHRDLTAEVEASRFRRDLYFRVCAAVAVLPPLRERPREIPLLARRFLADACARTERAPLAISPQAMDRLQLHSWPGNVRELRNVMEVAAAVAAGDVIEVSDLGPLEQTGSGPHSAGASEGAADVKNARARKSLAEELRDLERSRILEALESANGVQSRACEILGMPPRTLFAKLRAYAIDPHAFGVARARSKR